MKQYSMKYEEIGEFCRNLGLLLRSGTGSADAMTLLAEEETRADFHPVFKDMAEKMDRGTPLFQAVGEAGCFPGYVCSLLRVGEMTGRTEDTLDALAKHYDKRAGLERRLKSALLYPAILLLIMLCVIVVLLTEVLPVFNDVYARLGGRLTGVSGFLLSLGQTLGRAMPVLCAVAAVLTVIVVSFAASDGFRERVYAFWRKKHGEKGVSRKLASARCAQVLSMCLSSGMPLEEAMTLSAGILEDTPAAKKSCEKCAALLDGGASLSEAMTASGLFQPSQCRQLELGMKAGAAETVMEGLSDRLTEDAENALEKAVGAAEPAMVIVLSLLLGIILLSVMLPLMHIMTAIG